MNTPSTEITLLLKRIRADEAGARDRLGELVYAELRRMASLKMRGERPGHTLTPTALANEAWLRLCGNDHSFENRSHFFAVAAGAMRRLLIDYARARKAGKRAGGVRIPFEDVVIAAPETDEQLLSLDEALTRLAEVDSRAARVVELHYFAGLTHREIADILAVTRRTVDRDWTMARAWLLAAIAGNEQ
jgi:RNA polymerase sigma factor (TIGR02999 family)